MESVFDSHGDQLPKQLREAWLCPTLPPLNDGMVNMALKGNVAPSAAACLGGHLRVRALPIGVTAEELFVFFRGYGVPPLGIQFCHGNGECILRLSSPARAQRLLAEAACGRLLLFGSLLELLPATEEDILSCCALPLDAGSEQGMTAGKTYKTATIQVAGMPSQATRTPERSTTPQRSVAPLSREGLSARASRARGRSLSLGRFSSPSHSPASVNEAIPDIGVGVRQTRACTSSPSPSKSKTFPPRLPSQGPPLRRSRTRTPRTSPQSGRYATPHGSPASSVSKSPRPARPHKPECQLAPRSPETPSRRPETRGSRSSLRRVESAPPAVLGDLPVPAKYWEFSGQEFNVAVSPHKLEKLRKSLASVKREMTAVRASFQEDVRANSELAEQLEAGRLHLRDLRESDAAAALASTVGNDCQCPTAVPDNAEQSSRFNILRTETEMLAEELSVAAKRHLARCSSLRDLRVAAKLALIKRGLRGASKVSAGLSSDKHSKEQELSESIKASEALQLKAADLRGEIRQIVDKEVAIAAVNVQQEAALHEELGTLRAAFTNSVEARQSASSALSVQYQAQAVHRSNIRELSLRLGAARVASQRFARGLQDVSSQEGDLKTKLAAVQSRSAAAKIEAGNCNAANGLLEAELQQQRDATSAWQACVCDLAQSHIAISAETAKMATASREALHCGSAGLETSRHWGLSGPPMATR